MEKIDNMDISSVVEPEKNPVPEWQYLRNSQYVESLRATELIAITCNTLPFWRCWS